MSASTTDKVDIEVDLGMELRERLVKFCAKTGFDLESVFEAALSAYLDEIQIGSPPLKHTRSRKEKER